MGSLYYGDNLEILPTIPAESVDLVYLDPPFNSARNYNVIFARDSRHDANGAAAQIQAFEDTWTWTHLTDHQYRELINGGLPPAATGALIAMRDLLGENDASAYMVNMAPRLVELHRVLKPTGSLYLHCDPTMSHYLKIYLDAVFGPLNFRNEITWKRATTVKGNYGQGARHFGRNADTLLYYVKSRQAPFNPQFNDYTDEYLSKAYRYVEPDGRRYSLISMIGPGGAAKGNPCYEVMGVTRYWRYSQERMAELIEQGMVVQTEPGNVPRRKQYLDEGRGVAIESIWTDIPNLQASNSESLGYPTQKPVALLERIIGASSKPGDVVLDPFCGCGTAIEAAQRLGRDWIGIDITYIAVDLIVKRLEHTFGSESGGRYSVSGVPHDEAAALALFQRNPFDFERWAVSLVGAQPNDRQVGDKGVDGVARFPLGPRNEFGKILVSVKGGKTVGPGMVRDLAGAISAQQAQMGILITQTPPTKGMTQAANHAGSYAHPANGQLFPVIQLITTGQLLRGATLVKPVTLLPYIQALPSGAPDSPLF